MRFPHQMKLYTDQPPEPTLFPHTVCPQVPRVLHGVVQDSRERLTGSISCFLSHFSWVPPSGLQMWRRTAPFPSGACRSVSLHPLWLARRFSSWSLSWWTSSFLDPVHRGDSAFPSPKSGSAVLSCRAWEGETRDKWILYLWKVSANEICFLNCLQHLQNQNEPCQSSEAMSNKVFLVLLIYYLLLWFIAIIISLQDISGKCLLAPSWWMSRVSTDKLETHAYSTEGTEAGSFLTTAESWLYWTGGEVWWRWEGRKITTQLSRENVSAILIIRLQLLMRREFSRRCGPAIRKDQ